MTEVRSDAAALMRLQAEAIIAAADRLDPVDFGCAVDLVVGCIGKILVTGAGTSGNIARKLVATLTSTGSPAVFLHPGDALHGGLGIVGQGDVVIALSNSGETEEISSLLPHLSHRGVPIVAIVGNSESTLAQHSTVVLDAAVSREACPHDLTPTSSTSVALALGDALALSAMWAKSVSAEDFAVNHPSGRLGRRLTLLVDDVVRRGVAPPTVGPDAGFLEVVAAISSGGQGATVVEVDRRLIGLVTDGDLRRAVERTTPENLGALRADQVMTSEPVVVRSGTLAYDALRLMEDRPSQIGVLPVVEDTGRCRALLRLHDLVRAGL